MIKEATLAVLIFFFINSCGLKKVNNIESIPAIVVSDDSNIVQEQSEVIYHETEVVINDLIHIVLRARFDYEKKQLIGTAEIILKPHFYPTDSLTLDAKMFTLNTVEILKGDERKRLKYVYDNNKIKIKLDRTYFKNEEYTVFIDYIANPDKIQGGGTWAINSNKGLYFIDSDTNNPQIWTQGETQSNSGWLPTIDVPNQKMSQEIYLTVKREYKTLSNGVLVTSLLNDDGTRTDYWKQEKKHAPYLAMLAVGRFEIIKDYWRDTPVFIYAEKGDEENAKQVCGKTYKMIEFYSRKLKYDYPWDKYSQVFVRNFVSGAMENTGATVLGSYLLRFKNEKERIENESTVAHELSHQWFGDLVTCESWANLPLNESLATYMEYTWIEHEYGKIEADRHLAEDKKYYKWEYLFKNENLIRFYYKDRDDMFDTHSYQKGGMILHMLRSFVGDEAFWASLNLYLKNREYGTAEIHDLRLAFEEITGKDMNWFFNQWFLNKGIPNIEVKYLYNEEEKKQQINTLQTQKSESAPIYTLPVKIAFYFGDSVLYRNIILNKKSQKFIFTFDKKPDLIIFDSENCILMDKKTNKTTPEYIKQLINSTNYRDKIEAITYLKDYQFKREVKEIFIKLLNSDFWEYKLYALKFIEINKEDYNFKEYKLKVQFLAENDNNSEVKKLAESILEELK